MASINNYTYPDFCDGIEAIALQIKAQAWIPDYIVGIVRGGAIPAVMLSHRIGVPVVMVQWSTRDNMVHSNDHNSWIPEEILQGKKVLLVDDIVDNGDTVRQVLADWQASVRETLPGHLTRIASLVYNKAQPLEVDYYHKVIDRNNDKRWVSFFWEA